MGGMPYWYFVTYESALQHALDTLRDREFMAGRYFPVMNAVELHDPSLAEAVPGRGHATIAEACDAAGPDGTKSILDIERVADVPDRGVASPVSDDELMDIYGTNRPTRQQVESDMAFLASIERGECVYVVVYEDDVPSEVCFAGFSYD